MCARFTPTRQARIVGVLTGYRADLVLGDPQRGHTVAMFGQAAAKLEQVTYRGSRIVGGVHLGLLVGLVSLLGMALQRSAIRRCRPWLIVATTTVSWVSFGRTSRVHTGDVAAAAIIVRARSGPAGQRGPNTCGIRIGSGEHVGRRGDAAAVSDGGRHAWVLAYRAVNTLKI